MWTRATRWSCSPHWAATPSPRAWRPRRRRRRRTLRPASTGCALSPARWARCQRLWRPVIAPAHAGRQLVAHEWRWVPIEMTVQVSNGEYNVRASSDPRRALRDGDIIRIGGKRKWGRKATASEDRGEGAHVVVRGCTRPLTRGERLSPAWHAGGVGQVGRADDGAGGAVPGEGGHVRGRGGAQVDAVPHSGWCVRAHQRCLEAARGRLAHSHALQTSSRRRTRPICVCGVACRCGRASL